MRPRNWVDCFFVFERRPTTPSDAGLVFRHGRRVRALPAARRGGSTLGHRVVRGRPAADVARRNRAPPAARFRGHAVRVRGQRDADVFRQADRVPVLRRPADRRELHGHRGRVCRGGAEPKGRHAVHVAGGRWRTATEDGQRRVRVPGRRPDAHAADGRDAAEPLRGRVDAAGVDERHPESVPGLLGPEQAGQRGRAGARRRRRGRQRVHVPAVLVVRLRQAGPAVPAGPLGARLIPRRRRPPVLVRPEDGQHARLPAAVRGQRAPARHGVAVRPARRPVDHVRRRRQGAGYRGPAHELHAGDHVAQGRRDREVQLVRQRPGAGQHHGHVERRRRGLGVRLVLVRHAQRVQHDAGQDDQRRLPGLGGAVPGGSAAAVLDQLRKRIRSTRLAAVRIHVCRRRRSVYWPLDVRQINVPVFELNA